MGAEKWKGGMSMADAICPTDVSFHCTVIKEVDPTNYWTWPDRSEGGYSSTNRPPLSPGCDNELEDRISDGPYARSRLYDGTSYCAFGWTYTYYLQYQNEDGDWVEWTDIVTRTEFRGIDQKCTLTWNEKEGGAQGPWTIAPQR